ncbi:leucyl aminopeptidase [Prochlorococcus sp. MIT 1300]|uniref:leucyl aminopeptidase n=1 Tax=Prochlorococcus sp. MIT 1300 TaxID=3096218 RepID=UPI002A75BE37|nr:leucyl aminopeptidase [Prochlorococcus sp. MIT 1300]
MEFSLTPASLQEWPGAVLIVGIHEGDFETQLHPLESRFDAPLTKILEKQNFQAENGEITSFQLLQNSPLKLIVVGLGKLEDLSVNTFRNAAAKSAKESLGSEGPLGIFFPWKKLHSKDLINVVAEAIRLSLFKDLRFRSNPETKQPPKRIEFIGVDTNDFDNFKNISPICSGVELARELVGAPPNSLTPDAIAKEATKLSREFGLQLKVLSREECNRKGMGAYLAVAQGSDLDPKFIHLSYRSNGPIQRKVALVGKGLTFDSGGYNLKVGASQIELMKFDMGGSAAVIGAARAIAELRPQGVEVHFIVAACENMVNGSAVHPGDIVKASNGTTIEINNTDAEGRLTLADALVYASKLEPDSIIDLATLTGACVIALGDEIAGLWTDSDELSNELTKAAHKAGEGLWRMPLQNSYKEGLKSMLADIKNTGPRPGGSITAALFLREFVDQSISWAHIDIAGTVWSEKGSGVNPAGATGYGVRTLVNWIIREN